MIIEENKQENMYFCKVWLFLCSYSFHKNSNKKKIDRWSKRERDRINGLSSVANPPPLPPTMERYLKFRIQVAFPWGWGRIGELLTGQGGGFFWSADPHGQSRLTMMGEEVSREASKCHSWKSGDVFCNIVFIANKLEDTNTSFPECSTEKAALG